MKTTSRKRCERRPAVRAFSLAEATVAMLVVGVMLVAALNTLGATRMTQQRMTERSRGILLAQDLMAEILQQAYEDPDYGPGSFGLDAGEVGDGSRTLWEDVDDYDGWSESPPEQKDGTVITGFEGWGRSVAVDWVNPLNLSQVSGSDTRVKRIVVTVTRHEVVVLTLVAVRAAAGDSPLGGLIVDPGKVIDP